MSIAKAELKAATGAGSNASSALFLFEVLKVIHDLSKIFGRSVVRMLLPVQETICASVDDTVKMRCFIRCGSNHSLRLVGGIWRFEAEEAREQSETNRVCLWRTHLMLQCKRGNPAERIY